VRVTARAVTCCRPCWSTGTSSACGARRVEEGKVDRPLAAGGEIEAFFDELAKLGSSSWREELN
jgi:hypothetical protein